MSFNCDLHWVVKKSHFLPLLKSKSFRLQCLGLCASGDCFTGLQSCICAEVSLIILPEFSGFA